MGNFYLNYTVRSTDVEAITRLLEGHYAIVASTPTDHVIVYADVGEIEDPTPLAVELSRELETAVLVVMNHDDDILWYQLCENGVCLDEYDSTPNYFDGSATEIAPPKGGNAHALCQAFGGKDVEAIETALRRSYATNDPYVVAVERHADLAKLLNLPAWSYFFCYEDLVDDDLLEDLQEDYPDVTLTKIS